MCSVLVVVFLMVGFLVLVLGLCFLVVFGGDGLERERDIERKLKKRVESTGGWCLKFISSVSGIPDRICLFPSGRIIFVELKRHGEYPRPLQINQINKIKKLGFRVEVIDSEQGIEGLIRSVYDGENNKGGCPEGEKDV